MRSRWPTTRTSRPTSARARPPLRRTPSFRAAQECAALTRGVNWWRVRPLDQSSSAVTILGLYSAGQAFTWTPPVVRAAVRHAVRAGDRDRDRCQLAPDRLDGGCTADSAADVPATPIFDWDAQQYADFYRVLMAEDADFTNTWSRTWSRIGVALALTAPLRESSAGGSYYWYVIPCRGGTLRARNTCGPEPAIGSGSAGRQGVPQSIASHHRARQLEPSGHRHHFRLAGLLHDERQHWVAGRDWEPVRPDVSHRGRH